MEVITLSLKLYQHLPESKRLLNLDFDDIYQMEIAKEHNLKLVTLDSDFKKVKEEIEITFI